MTVVVALYLPYTSLNVAIISYMMAMSTYLTARGVGTDWVTDLDNTKVTKLDQSPRQASELTSLGLDPTCIQFCSFCWRDCLHVYQAYRH